MSGELAAVGATSATALVTAMTTDGWGSVRAWFGTWLGRGRSEDEQQHLVRLDRDRLLLLGISPEEEGGQERRLTDAWEVRLQDIADVDPEAAHELQRFVERWRAEHPEAADRPTAVRQQAKASGHARIVQVGRDQLIVRPERS